MRGRTNHKVKVGFSVEVGGVVGSHNLGADLFYSLNRPDVGTWLTCQIAFWRFGSLVVGRLDRMSRRSLLRNRPVNAISFFVIFLVIFTFVLSALFRSQSSGGGIHELVHDA